MTDQLKRQPGQKVALLSAFNKDGLESFAQALIALGWWLMASAGTAKFLHEKGLQAQDVAEIVGPPILGHKVVTLSRELHAALLADESPEEQGELDRLGIPRIDLVYVDLYPLEDEIKKPDKTLASVLQKTDIGGPVMLRSAMKGRRIALHSSDQFEEALTFIRGEPLEVENGEPYTRDEYLSYLAAEVESRVADYCLTSSDFHDSLTVRHTNSEG